MMPSMLSSGLFVRFSPVASIIEEFVRFVIRTISVNHILKMIFNDLVPDLNNVIERELSVNEGLVKNPKFPYHSSNFAHRFAFSLAGVVCVIPPLYRPHRLSQTQS